MFVMADAVLEAPGGRSDGVCNDGIMTSTATRDDKMADDKTTELWPDNSAPTRSASLTHDNTCIAIPISSAHLTVVGKYTLTETESETKV